MSFFTHFSNTLLSKILIWFFVLAILPIAILLIFVIPRFEEEFVSQEITNTQAYMSILAERLSLENANDRITVLARQEKTNDQTYTLLDGNGIFLFDTNREYVGLSAEQVLSKNVLDKALRTIIPDSAREGNTIVGFAQLSNPKAIIIYTKPLTPALQTIASIRNAALLQFGVGLLIVAIMSGVIILLGMRPLKELVNASTRVEQGDLAYRINLSDMDAEFANIATSFNMMVTTLQSNQQKLSDDKKELEVKMNELKQKIESLEKQTKKLNQ